MTGVSSSFKNSIVCVLNGGAGSSRALEMRERLAGLFVQHGLKVRLLVSGVDGEMAILARQAVEGRPAIVIAGGGDGTVNCVASALIGTQILFGVLPMGTLNHFAKDLKIPLELEAAVANLAAGHVARVDVGAVNDRFFLNNSSLGLYPKIVREREERQRLGHGKWLAFAEATLYVLRRYSHLYVRLQEKGEDKIEEQTPFVFVGNNRYETKGLHIGERTRLDEGRLWVYRAPRASHWTLFRLALRALRGGEDLSELAILDTEEFWVGTGKSLLHVATDGEVIKLKAPLHYRILPRALSVIVPAGEDLRAAP